jgi:hypothetical protein
VKLDLADALCSLGQSGEGESLARECLAATKTRKTQSGLRAIAKSVLGHALTQQSKYREAAPLVLQGYRELSEAQGRGAWIHPPDVNRARDRLIKYYQASGQAEEAARLRSEK